MILYTSLEITPMRQLSPKPYGDRSDIVTIRPIKLDEVANLWTVLARDQDGSARIQSDKRSRREAVAFARRFRRHLDQKLIPIFERTQTGLQLVSPSFNPTKGENQ